MKTVKLLTVLSLAIMLTACCACRKNRSMVPLDETEWRLTQLHGANISSDNYRMRLSADGKISGIGDCNRFTGTFTRSEGESRSSGTISVAENLVSTRMMCLNQAQEDKFLKMLRDADGYSIDGKRLMLLRGGDVLAIFEVAGPEPFAKK